MEAVCQRAKAVGGGWLRAYYGNAVAVMQRSATKCSYRIMWVEF